MFLAHLAFRLIFTFKIDNGSVGYESVNRQNFPWRLMNEHITWWLGSNNLA